MPSGTGLFDEVVALTGVSRVLAPGMVTRALADGGVSVADATAHDYEEALPRLKARLKAYLPPEQAEERAEAILKRLLQLRAPAARPTPAGLVRSRVAGQRDALRESGENPTAEPAARSAGPDHAAAGAARPSGASPGTPAHEPVEDDDFTLVGRRWTADEQAALDALRRRGPGKK